MIINKSVILGFLILFTNILFSQTFSYKWNGITREISSFEKHIFKFNYMHTYDMDFEENSDSFPVECSFLIEKKYSNSNGRLIIMWDGVKSSLKILSCFSKTYNESSNEYFEFKCENEYGATIYFFLDESSNKKGWRFWSKMDGEKRMYFTKYN